MIALLEAQRAGLRRREHWLNERVAGKLEKAGLLDQLGRENFCTDLLQALNVLNVEGAAGISRA
jgi:hypothetical protein